jgi:hypothetical protein
MKTKGIVIGAMVLLAVLFAAVTLSGFRSLGPSFTVRHVNSVCSNGITTMTFEITNHTAEPCIFQPFELQIQNTNGWSQFQDFDKPGIRPHPPLDAFGVAIFTIKIVNLPGKSAVRFSARVEKSLLGIEGFVIRAKVNWKRRGGSGILLPLNPYDKNSHIYGKPTKVMSEEWVETAN